MSAFLFRKHMPIQLEVCFMPGNAWELPRVCWTPPAFPGMSFAVKPEGSCHYADEPGSKLAHKGGEEKKAAQITNDAQDALAPPWSETLASSHPQLDPNEPCYHLRPSHLRHLSLHSRRRFGAKKTSKETTPTAHPPPRQCSQGLQTRHLPSQQLSVNSGRQPEPWRVCACLGKLQPMGAACQIRLLQRHRQIM